MTFPTKRSLGLVLAAACLTLAACQYKAPRSQSSAAARTTALAAVTPVREAAPAPARPSATTSRATPPPQLVAVDVDEPPLILLEQQVDGVLVEQQVDGLLLDEQVDGVEDAP